MLQTITRVKEMNIIELLEYARKHHKHGKMFKSKDGWQVFVDDSGFSIDTAEETQPIIWFSETFEVEVEEPIKDVTLLKEVVYVHDNEALIKDYDTSIDEILSRHHKGSVSEIHALINGRLELVYERDGDE
ncbi:hypothetical protein LNK15_03140 [Jeotgalicoccus huakuii]|nr:hypothetical protein [Jeotgalicoccus huakuii]